MSPRAQNVEILAAFLQDGVDVRLRLFGFSMKPLMMEGSVVTFSAKVEPEVGDIVLLRFQNGPSEKLVAHRVLALDDGTITTKGDSSRAADPPTPRARVLGTAIALETRAGKTPLRNAWMRTLGLTLSALYPRAVRAYRAIRPRKPTEEALECAS